MRTKTAAVQSPAEEELEDPPLQDDGDEAADPTDTTSLTAAADEVVPFLKQASYSALVALEYPNKVDDPNEPVISAYAKIAGKDWTYYVKKERIDIGRSPDGFTKTETGLLAQQSSPGPQTEELPFVIDIDLGPSKLISRFHARCFYDYEDEKWHIIVNGRNGIRVNDVLIRRGQDVALGSGDIIEVGGTEMMFVSPDVSAVVQPQYRARLHETIKEENPVAYSSDAHSHPELRRDGYEAGDRTLPSASSSNLPLINGQTVIAPALQDSQQPTTPTKATVPVTQRSAKAINGHTVALESKENFDYSSDAQKDKKPNCSYATLIAQAILSVPEERLPLSGIYEWIKAHFSYYRHMEGGWQNSIRHNLSLNQAFCKTTRETHEPGKGGMWYIREEKKEQFKKDGLKMTSRGGARQSSGPNSPGPKKSPKKTPPSLQAIEPSSALKGSPIHQTPPLSAYPPAPQESYTPSRGPRVSVTGVSGGQTLPQLSDDASPVPPRPSYLNRNAAAAGSPPTLSSSAYFNEDQQSGYNLFTPAPIRHEPKMIAPSTAKLPSQYLPQSSPAPFWNFNGDFGSTPAGLPESSPVRAGGSAPAPPLLLPPQSSSPPPTIANGSPTKIRGLPIDAKVNGPGTSHILSIKGGIGRAPVMDDDDDDDGQLDLMG